MTQRRGFTLIEVIVAIAILAVAFAAASRSVGASIETQHQLKLRVFADWVAQNRLAQHHAQNAWLELGTKQGDAQMAGEAFVWTETISTTPNPQFRRIDVSVSLAPPQAERELAKITGFLTGPNS